ncbi:thioester domain-containing protein [Amycolatopsis anabasis]|uniref:thioester domain-containing protein n=1 Tax=Amycolatopsis anabasis TaxID=1840409 RepID=UPI00131B7AB4|nr:thioester domain-containing protein [Amycolatopsis anabasis]
MAGRVNLAKAGAVVGASAMLMLSAAMPASADDPVTAKVTGKDTGGLMIKFEGMGAQRPVLFELELSDQTKLRSYCVELGTLVVPGHPEMIEVPWDKYPKPESPFHKNRGKIKWVLQHGYPSVDTKALAGALPKDVQLKDGISEPEAIAATQAVVWTLSDDVKLDRNVVTPDDADSKGDVLAVYDYLLKNAKDTPEEAPALKITPAQASGEVGKKVGPFKVSTTAEALELTSKLPEGVKLVDGKGNAVAAKDLKNGSEFYLDVPASAKPGDGTVTLNGTADLSLGRLFIGKNYAQKPTQSMILAKAEKTKLEATAKASWKAAPAPGATPTVPVKIPAGDQPQAAAAESTSATPFVLGGGALVLAAGGGLLAASRRRRATQASTED